MNRVSKRQVAIGAICATLVAPAARGFAFLAASQFPSRAASISGRVIVIDAGVPSPVRRARVSLTSSTGLVLSADSDTEGRFRFEGLRPGAYGFDVKKLGFYVDATAPNGATPVQIQPNLPALKDIVMERGASIEGQLSDTNGAPVQNALVRVLPFGRQSAPLSVAIRPGRTDELGRFRLHTLPQGQYLIEAEPASLPRGPAGRTDTASTRDVTYYPGVRRAEDAKPIQVSLRAAVTGIDFTVSTQHPMPVPPSADRRSEAVRPSPGDSRIGGRVTRAEDGTPLAGAFVNIYPWNPPFTGRVTGTTNDDGRFDLVLPPGRYRVSVTAQGYASRVYGSKTGDGEDGTSIETTEGYVFQRADVVLPRNAVIEGRVLDEFGDPAPDVLVQLATTQFIVGSMRLWPLATRTSQPSDDRGAFRFADLPPGDYYVTALSGPFAPASDMRGFALTLYPGTRSGSEARPVHLSPGAVTSNVEFSLMPTTVSELHGMVLTPNGDPVSPANISLRPMTGGDVRLAITATTTAAADGSFVFHSVPQGSYVIQAGTPFQGGSFGYSTVDVAGDTVSARIQIRPNVTARGNVIFDGPPPYPSYSDIFFASTTPIELVSTPAQIQGWVPKWVDDTFIQEKVYGQLVIRAMTRPDSWVLTRVQLGEKDVTDKPIDFTLGDVGNIKITFEAVGGTVKGSVTDGQRQVNDYSVVVFSTDPAQWAWPSRFVRMGRPNQDGFFQVSGLLPGNYQAAALPRVSNNTWMSPEFLSSLAAKATVFPVSPRQTQTLTLRITN